LVAKGVAAPSRGLTNAIPRDRLGWARKAQSVRDDSSRAYAAGVPIHWDDLYVVRTLDRLEGLNRAYNENGEDLMNAVTQKMRIADTCQDPD